MRSLLYLAGVSLLVAAGCSSGADKTAAAQQNSPSATSPTSALVADAGQRVDSLNGMQSHTFGEPRTNFSKLLSIEPGGPGQYIYLREHETGWFGLHSPPLVVFYVFQRDKFISCLVRTKQENAPLLLGQAQHLFGPGKLVAEGQYCWNGQRARADFWTAPDYTDGQRLKTYLRVSSQAGFAALRPRDQPPRVMTEAEMQAPAQR